MNQIDSSTSPVSMRAKRCSFALFFATLCAAFALCMPIAAPAAWADGESESNGCTLSDADRQAYEADGTLDDRIAYMQSLGADSFDSRLIAQAQARESGVATLADSSVPWGWKTGMPTTGTARVLAVCVQFPDSVNVFSDIETERASLDAMFNGSSSQSGTFPYDSLRNYYYRSSYGKLDIKCGATLTYTAAYPRDYYTYNPNALFYEVAKAIDDNPDTYGVDLSDFDGNGDGVLDALYVLFAGENTGWGSTWWPTMRHYSNTDESAQTSFGHGNHKVTPDASVLLDKTQAASPDDRQPVCTLIHETGHVLGLPDYYHYSDGSSSTAQGIGVFDMMNSNQGDHNAFSKWLLGWIDDADITRVCVSENGVKAVRGSQSFETSGTLEQTLEAFDSDNVSKTGGFIAVSSSESIFDTLLGSFYLLQYDQYAGNQSLIVTTESGGAHMRSGLRAFRVQAALNQSGSNFVKSNSNATSQHDQLIESLNPADDGVTPIAFGNFFDEGRIISPSSTPSTNFEESVDFGYTGISIAVGASETARGTVGISYAGKPETADFTLEPTAGFQLTDTGTFTLSMSRAAQIASRIEPWPMVNEPQLLVDGTPHNLGATQANGTDYTFNLALEPGTLHSSSKCQLVFPEGYFVIGKQNDQVIYSNEIAVDLPVAALTEIEKSGAYDNFDAPVNAAIATSNAYESNGSTKFLRKASWLLDDAGTQMRKSLALCTFADNGAACTEESIDISGVSFGEGFAWNSAQVDAKPLGNGIVFARIASTNYSTNALTGAYVWIDEATHAVVASQPFMYASAQSILMNVDGAAVIASPQDNTRWLLTRMMRDEKTGAISESYALIQGDGSWVTECVFDAGEGYIAVSNKGLTGGTHTKLYAASDIASLFVDPSQGALDPSAFQQLVPAMQATMDTMTDEQGNQTYAPLWPSDAKMHDGKLYVAYVQPMFDATGGAGYPKPRVVCFNMDGTIAWSSIFPDSQFIASNATFELSFNSNGIVALTGNTFSSMDGTTNEIIFISQDGTQLSRNVNKADFGAWVGARWLALSSTILQEDETWTYRTLWYLSKEMGAKTPEPSDPAKPDDPTGPTDPTTPTDPTQPTQPTNPSSTTTSSSTQNTQQPNALSDQADFANTGDATWNIALVVAGLAFASCGIILVAHAARKRVRSK